MKRIHALIPALLTLGLALAASGCVVHGRTHVGVRAHAHYTPPRLVYVSPGVQVVYDYHEPVFYSDGFYWRYYGGVWYRSSYHSHGWVRWHSHRVPRTIVRIDRPNHYVRYRGEARGHGHVRGGGHYERPGVRDHRDGRGRARPAKPHVDHRTTGSNAPPPRTKKKSGVKVRDHR